MSRISDGHKPLPKITPDLNKPAEIAEEDIAQNPILRGKIQQQAANQPIAPVTRDNERKTLPQELPAGLQSQKMTAAEQERLLLSSGYVRVRRKGEKGISLDGMTEAPIPLPEDDIDEDAKHQQNSFDEAASALAENNQLMGAIATLIEPGAPIEQFLQTLCEQAALDQVDEAEALQHLQALTLIDLANEPENQPLPVPSANTVAQWEQLKRYFKFTTNEPPPGDGICKVLMAMLVAGIVPEVPLLSPQGTLDAHGIAAGMEKLLGQSHEAVANAKKSMAAIAEKRALMRTFVVKR